MALSRSRVGVVGGSLAGCAAATVLRRIGCDVTVYERTTGELRSRGVGIALPIEMQYELVSGGYLQDNVPFVSNVERNWVVEPGGGESRLIWRQHLPAAFTNWGLLWQGVRAGVPDGVYRAGVTVTDVRAGDDGVEIAFADGPPERFDLVIGADGYQSRLRRLVHPRSRLSYAGYVLWRGTCEEHLLTDPVLRELTHRGAVTTCFDGGHAILYRIPAGHGGLGGDGGLLNWGVYGRPPEWFALRGEAWVPPGRVDGDLAGHLVRLVDERLSEGWRRLVRGTGAPRLAVQPIFDLTVPSYVSGRVLLMGDAGTVARPHTGAGAVKALRDAIALGRIAGEHDDWRRVFAVYDAERRAEGNATVDLGRRLGHAQVEQTPDWAGMTTAAFQEWVRDTVAGGSRYLYTELGDG
ncbi:2-polyprenyl-6-methoxyphenol hydroxylase [Sphaerisporangium krabiense]|nr:2-polyprenyl-6-methoxyphenol hydroxylase [Sphaerisporangium krabiense]